MCPPRACAQAPLIPPPRQLPCNGGPLLTRLGTQRNNGGQSGLLLRDEDGNSVPIVACREVAGGQVEAEFVARQVPGPGVRVYRVSGGRAADASGADQVGPGVLHGVDRGRPVAGAPAALASPVIANSRFRVEGDDHGLLRILDLRTGRTVCAAGEYRPGELLLEHDEGSPWATLHPDQTRLGLAPNTRLIAAERGDGWQRLRYEVESPPRTGLAGRALHARVVVTLVEGLERVDCRIEAHWEAFNHRLRLAMPVPFAGRHLYGIPYGVLERRPYAPTYDWTGANGDWPAINWAGVEGGDGSVALLSRGLPSYRMQDVPEGGTLMLLSLLRSPAIPTYLHEPEHYAMTAWDGMRDAGDHAFDVALAAYDAPLLESVVVLDAEAYNAGLVAVPGRVRLPGVPRLESDVARLAAVKWAEQGKALVLRVCESRGTGGVARIVLPAACRSAARVNLLEREGVPLQVHEGGVSLELRAWEVLTVRCECEQRARAAFRRDGTGAGVHVLGHAQ